MKFLMEVGTQLDLDVAYNGGAADAGLIYTVPEGNGFITVNTTTGVVDAVAEGESVVWVYSGTPSVLVATVVIEVASAATYAERLAIRQGDNEVIVTAGAAGQVPQSLVLISDGTAIASSVQGYTQYGGVSLVQVFAGVQGIQWESISVYQDVVNEWVGKQFSQPKAVKKVRARFVSCPSALSFQISNDMTNWTSIDQQAVGDYYTGALPGYHYELTGDNIWLEFDMPSYGGAVGFRVKPANSSWPSGVPTDGGPNVDRWRIAGLEFYE